MHKFGRPVHARSYIRLARADDIQCRHTFCPAATLGSSDYSWWSIIDRLLFHTCHDLMSSVLQPLLPYKTVPINKLG